MLSKLRFEQIAFQVLLGSPKQTGGEGVLISEWVGTLGKIKLGVGDGSECFEK